MHLQVVGRRNVDGPAPPGALEQRAALASEGLHLKGVMWEAAVCVPTIPYELAGRINGDAEREDADQVCPTTGVHGAEGHSFGYLFGLEFRVLKCRLVVTAPASGRGSREGVPLEAVA